MNSKTKRRWPWIVTAVIFLILLVASLVFNFAQYQKTQDLSDQKQSLRNTSSKRKRTLVHMKDKNQVATQQVSTYRKENKGLSKNSHKLDNQKNFSNMTQKYLVDYYNFDKNSFQNRKWKLSSLTTSSALDKNLPEKQKNQLNKTSSKLLNYKTFPQSQNKSEVTGIALVNYEETSPTKQKSSDNKQDSSDNSKSSAKQKAKTERKTVLYQLVYNTDIKKLTHIKNLGSDLKHINMG